MNGRQTYEEVIKVAPNQKAVMAGGFAETEDVKAAQWTMYWSRAHRRFLFGHPIMVTSPDSSSAHGSTH